MRTIFSLGLLAWALLWVSCGDSGQPGTAGNFYHWRTRLDLGAQERQAMEDLGARKLYVKFFDIDIDPRSGLPAPSALVELHPESLPDGIEVIPCIYITNKTFLGISEQEVSKLAEKCGQLLSELHSPLSAFPWKEVQIDCDWTQKTREAYFSYLKSLRTHLPLRDLVLSATIRLHQYKYPEQTGLPPVDRGVLMAYNVGDLADPEESNSIFQPDLLDRYLLPPSPYPLDLDVALPIFAWTVLLRKGRTIKLLNNTRMADLEANPKMKKTAANRVQVLESHYFGGHYLYTGDELRAEAISPEDLLDGANRIARTLPQYGDVVFFHLDTLTLKHYDIQDLQTAVNAFD